MAPKLNKHSAERAVLDSIFQSVLTTGSEVVLPVTPDLYSLETVIEEATSLRLRLAGVPAGCLTVLPQIPVDEDSLYRYCRAYCLASDNVELEAEVRQRVYEDVENMRKRSKPLSNSKSLITLFHPADIVTRVMQLSKQLLFVPEEEYHRIVQQVALLQLREIQRVCYRVRREYAAAEKSPAAVAALLGLKVPPNKKTTKSEVLDEPSADKLDAQQPFKKRVIAQPVDRDEPDDLKTLTEVVDDTMSSALRKAPRYLQEKDFTIVSHSGVFFDEANHTDTASQAGKPKKVAAVLIRRALDESLCHKAAAALESAATTKNLRTLTNGGEVPPDTGIVGYYDYLNNAISRKCRETQFTRDNWPAVAGSAAPLLKALDKVYRENAPVHYRAQRQAIPKAYQLFDTAFSTVTVNRNFRTAVHTDKGDFRSGLGCLAIVDGQFEGCHLAVPKLGVAFRLKVGDVLLFDTSLEHGNTEVLSAEGMWHRVSLVCYFRTGLMSQRCIEEQRKRLDIALTSQTLHEALRTKSLLENGTVCNVNALDSALPPLFLPVKLRPLLSEVQDAALSFAEERVSKNTGCIIAMAMGMGKTLLALALCFSELFSKPEEDVLIITPKTIIPHWIAELEKWRKEGNLTINKFLSPDLGNSTVGYHEAILRYNQQCAAEGGVSKVGHCFLMNPEGLPAFLKRCPRFNPNLIIVDEGHRVSAKQSKLKECLDQLQSRKRVVLSGTPVQNHCEELYRLVSWIDVDLPLILPQASFQEYANVIHQFVAGDDSVVEQARVAQQFLMEWQKGYLFRCVDPNLPPLHDLLVVCGSSGCQKRQRCTYGLETCDVSLKASEHRTYHLAAHPLCLVSFLSQKDAAALQEADDEEQGVHSAPVVQPIHIDDIELCKTVRQQLAQQCNGGDAGSAIEEVASLSGKMMTLLSIVQHCCDTMGEKVVIFSQYVGVQEMIQLVLNASNIATLSVNGKDSVDTRRRTMERFCSLPCANAAALVVSTRVGAFGVDLTVANHVVLFDSWWNPMVDAQAVARCYRRNQSRGVTVYRLAAEAEDSSIIRAHQRKLALFKSVIDGKISQKFGDAMGAAMESGTEAKCLSDPDDFRRRNLWMPLMGHGLSRRFSKQTTPTLDEGSGEERVWESDPAVFKVLRYADLVVTTDD